jgi:hypothetical protein
MSTGYGENIYKKYGQPTLDLQFSGPKGSIRNRADGGNTGIEFTRTQDTQASYVGSDGLIKYAAVDEARFDHDPVTGAGLGLLVEEAKTNNILYSDALDGGKWLSPFAFSRTVNIVYQAQDPAGTFRAKEVRSTSDSGSAYHSYYSNGGVGTGNWNFSIYVKPVNITTLSIYVDGAYAVGATTFDLSGLGSIISGPGSFTKLSNGWWRLSTYGDITTQQRADCSINYTSVGDNSVAFYLWGAQLEARTFPTSYIPTTPTFASRASEATYYDQNGIVSTASTDVARDNAYFPDENGNFISAGLLLEGERTNLFPYSEDLSNSAIFTSASFTSTTELDVTGGSNACILTEDTTVSSVHRFNGYFTAWQTTGVHSYKFFAKPNGRTKCQVSRKTTFIDDFTHIFTLTGIGSATGGGSISKLPNDWYELTGSFNVNNTSNTGINFFLMDDLENITYDGDGTSGMIIFGKQIEEGSYATSYIPTTSGISTRAADISSSSTSTRGTDLVQITGSNFSSLFPSVGSGSVFVEGDVIGEKLNTSVGSFASFGTNQNDNFLYFLGYDNRDNVGFIQPSGGNVSKYHDLTGKTFKGATAWTDLADSPSTGGSTALDGDLYGGSQWGYAGVQNPANYDRFGIGRAIRSSTTSNTINGHVKRLTYWPTRLPDSDLQRLTE